MTDALRNSHFEEIDDVQTDSRNRVSLGRKLVRGCKHYRLYQDKATGQILLQPMQLMPLSDNWLDFASEARKSVEKGLADAKAGRIRKARI